MIRRHGGPGICGVGGIPLASMGMACPGGGNGLLNALIAYWPGDEASGNALDAHTNALHLTDTNTVTSNPGIVYPLARQYTAANSEYHRRLGDDALLSTGDVDFTIMSWVYHDTVATEQAYVMKWAGAGAREYYVELASVANRIRFAVSNDGTATVLVAANTLGVPVINTWYCVIAWHDSVANTTNIQVNNGGVDSLAHATGVFDSATALQIGAYGAGSGAKMNGRIGPSAFWKSAAGGGGVLTAAQRTALFNGGAGLTYAQLTT